jgi:predicted phage gp36 major capsid-like protein
MNDQQLENKIRQDAEKIRKDLHTLGEDSIARLGRLEENVKHAAGNTKDDVNTWVENSASQVSDRFEKLSEDAKKSFSHAAATAKRDVGHGLNQYNSSVQKLADKLPNGLSDKIAKFPWVAMTVAVIAGFVVASLFRPSRN